MMRVLRLGAIGLLLSVAFVVEGAPVQTIASNERILMGSILAPDRSQIEPFTVLFRGEKKETDGSGFFSFVKKADKETFETIPFSQKMLQAKSGGEKINMPDEEAISVSPLLSTSGKRDKFYVLVTKDLEPVLEGTNDISGFRQHSGSPHLFFSCIAQNAQANEVEILIKPTSIEKRNFLYDPSRTIVILMNPNRVKKIEYSPFKLDSQFIQLPRIVLQTEAEINGRKQSKVGGKADSDDVAKSDSEAVDTSKKSNLARQSVKSNMYGLDLAPFFEAPDTVELSKRISRNQLVEIRL